MLNLKMTSDESCIHGHNLLLGYCAFPIDLLREQASVVAEESN